MSPTLSPSLRIAVASTVATVLAPFVASQAQTTSALSGDWGVGGSWTLQGSVYAGQLSPDRQDRPPTFGFDAAGATTNQNVPYQTPGDANNSDYYSTTGGNHVWIFGGNTIDITTASSHGSGQIGFTSGAAGGGTINFNPLGGETGYVETPDTLDIGLTTFGYLTQAPATRLDVGMRNGGAFLPGAQAVQDGQLHPNAPTADGFTNTHDDLGPTNSNAANVMPADYSVLPVGVGSAPADFRDQSQWHVQDNPNRQFDLPADPNATVASPGTTPVATTDVDATQDQFYNPTHTNPSAVPGSTDTNGPGGFENQALPLFDLGGFLNIGSEDTSGAVTATGQLSHTDPTPQGAMSTNAQSNVTGRFDMDGGVLNVVQYGWTWATENDIDWYFATDGGESSRFEGWDLDPDTGAYGGDAGAGTGEAGTAREDSSAGLQGSGTNSNRDDDEDNFMYIAPTQYTYAASEQIRGAVDLNSDGDTLDPGEAAIVLTGGTRDSTAPFPDPTAAQTNGIWRQDGPNGALLDNGSIASNNADRNTNPFTQDDPFYMEIVRSGGNIRVGNTGDSTGEFNINNGFVTTNNLQVGRRNNATGIVNQRGGDVYLRENVILSGHTNTTQGIYNFGDSGANNIIDTRGVNAINNFNADTGNTDGTFSSQYYGRTAAGGAVTNLNTADIQWGTDGWYANRNAGGAAPTGHATALTSQYLLGGRFDSDRNEMSYGATPATIADAPTGGGVLEIARDLQIGNTGYGLFNHTARTTWVDEFGATRMSHLIVGDDILLASGSNQSVGIFNFSSPVNLYAANRNWDNTNADNNGDSQNIVIGDRSGNGSDALGIFNYNPEAGLLGGADYTPGAVGTNTGITNSVNTNSVATQQLATDVVLPRFDNLFVAEGEDTTGYFNHNNHRHISLDGSVIVGDQPGSVGYVNLIGQPESYTSNHPDYVAGADFTGGIHADDRITIGQNGTGIFNQTGLTDVASQVVNNNGGAPTSGQERDIVIARYHESTSDRSENRNGQVVGNRARRSYGEYNFGLPSAAEQAAGQVVGGTFAQMEGYTDQGTPDAPTISTVRDLIIGQGGDGSFNHYANSDLSVMDDIQIGGQNYGVGEYNLLNNTGVTVSVGVETADNDTGHLEIGEAGKGTFNMGAFASVTPTSFTGATAGYNQLDPAVEASKLPAGMTQNTGTTPDTYDGTDPGSAANSTLEVAGDLIVGGAKAYEVENHASRDYTTIIRDSGEGHFNFNAPDATLDVGRRIEIGTGDNIQEGIHFDRNGANNLGDIVGLENDGTLNSITRAQRQGVNHDGDGTTPNIIVPTNARIPWINAAGATNSTAGTGSYLGWSGHSAHSNGDASDIDPTIATGTNYGIKGDWHIDPSGNAVSTLYSDVAGTDPGTYYYVPGPEDGHGSVGYFNHNNNVDQTYAQADITIGDGDNSQGFYNQNGTGNVTMTGDLEMSVDRYDAGDATGNLGTVAAAINAQAFDPQNGGFNTANTDYEMGQSTWTVNNANAVFDLAGNNVIGDSIDVAGRGVEAPDPMATMSMKGDTHGNNWTAQNRDNEAQITLLEGEIRNTRIVEADIYQFGGHFDMGHSASAAVTTDLLDGMGAMYTPTDTDGDGVPDTDVLSGTGLHDFIQLETNTSYTNPLTWTADTSLDGQGNPNNPIYQRDGNGDLVLNAMGDPIQIGSKAGPTIEFNWFGVDGNLNSGAPSGVGMNTGTVNTDTLLADHIQLNADPGSIQIDLSAMPAGYFTNLNFGNNGDYWNLLDWTDDFNWGAANTVNPVTGGLGNDTSILDNAPDLMAFNFGLGMGVLPTLTDASDPTREWFWSIDPNGPGGIEGNFINTPGGTDIWQTHGILYIYTVPEPSRAVLLMLGLAGMLLRRRR